MNELVVMKIKDTLKVPGIAKLFIWGEEVDKQSADQAGHAPWVSGCQGTVEPRCCCGKGF